MKRSTLITISYIFIILIASSVAFYFGYQRERIGTGIQPQAINGIIDFTNIDFDKQVFARLKGDYEFYWDQLLDPSDFVSKEKQDLTGYIFLPGLWNGFNVNGKELNGNGFATFRLKIKVNKDGLYGIKIKEFDCAYKMWVNGSSFISVGKVGADKSSTIPSWRRREVYFASINKEVDVILQVANFRHRKGGPEDVMFFGTAENIITYKNQQLAIGLFLFGILMIMSIYHLILYFYRRKDVSIILFSALCFVMTLRLITTGEKILIDVFPNINWAFAVRIEYLSYKLAVPLFTAFIYSFFPKDIPKIFVKVVSYVAIIFSLIVILTPVGIFSYTPMIYEVFIAINKYI